ITTSNVSGSVWPFCLTSIIGCCSGLCALTINRAVGISPPSLPRKRLRRLSLDARLARMRRKLVAQLRIETDQHLVDLLLIRQQLSVAEDSLHMCLKQIPRHLA